MSTHKFKKFLYQKYIVPSSSVGYAPLSWKLAKVQNQKDSRLTIKGDEDQDPVASEEVWTRPVIVPITLLVRVQCFR